MLYPPQIGASLWALSLAGRSVSAVGLAFTVWILAFTVPKVWHSIFPVCCQREAAAVPQASNAHA
jgi:hypothetical protein